MALYRVDEDFEFIHAELRHETGAHVITIA
jgi:hypothetical protein